MNPVVSLLKNCCPPCLWQAAGWVYHACGGGAALSAADRELARLEKIKEGLPVDTTLLGALEGLANRGYTDGFYQRHHDSERQNYLRGHSESSRSLYVGDVIGWNANNGLAEIEVKNRFSVGDRLEIIHPSGNREMILDSMRNAAGDAMTVAPGNGHRVFIPLPAGLGGALLARFL